MSLETNKSAKTLGEVSYNFIINTIQDEHFRDCQSGQKAQAHLENLSDIFNDDETWQIYTLIKEDQKMYIYIT